MAPRPHLMAEATIAPSLATAEAAMAALATSPAGLSAAEAVARRSRYGANQLAGDSGRHPLRLLLSQFRSPMVLILLGAAVLSFGLGQVDEAIIVMVIVLASTGLGFSQEYQAGNAVAALRRRIAVTVRVRRSGSEETCPAAELVPGDIVLLRAGALVPADAVLLKASALHVDEAALTGESFPVVKALTPPDNIVHMGTSIRSGEGEAVVTAIGRATEFGGLAAAVSAQSGETSFARFIRQFGLLMTRIMLVLIVIVLVANVLLGRPVLDSLLFAAALAVGITPELLPAIVTVTLSQGARRLAGKGVLVRRLVAIENLGAMNILCTDKTGTLTQGDVALALACAPDGTASADVLALARQNAALQTALASPLDTAILATPAPPGFTPATRLGELPYDFERKRLSIVIDAAQGPLLICKGAADAVLALTDSIAEGGSTAPLTAERRAALDSQLEQWGLAGHRVLAVATRPLARPRPGLDDEMNLTLCGFLLFSDPLKPGIADTIAGLARSGISLRIISGDSRHAARHVAEAIGLAPHLLTGQEIASLHGAALTRRIRHANVFAEITPEVKERIILALRRSGATIGYLGDGINDAPALRAADIGISVDNAVDAARAAADIILLKQDLDVLHDGVRAGRTAFGNTIKYIVITISANFGNMVSMALASLFLPFLPLLAAQILVNNLLSDLPMLAISTDRVDEEVLQTPRRWDFAALLRTMLGFGLISSLFDGLTFATLLLWFGAGEALFQTGWFVESLLTELSIVAVMRTARPLWRSRPGRVLTLLSAAVAAFTLALPFLPLGGLIGLTPLPLPLLATLVGIVLAYVLASEALKARLTPLAAPASSPSRARAHRARWWE